MDTAGSASSGVAVPEYVQYIGAPTYRMLHERQWSLEDATIVRRDDESILIDFPRSEVVLLYLYEAFRKKCLLAADKMMDDIPGRRYFIMASKMSQVVTGWLYTNRHVVHFAPHSIADIPLFESSYVPKYNLIGRDDTWYKHIKTKDMQIILRSDPVAVYLGLLAGDVVHCPYLSIIRRVV